MVEIQFPVTPALMTADEFARWHGLSPTVVRECMAGTSKNYPPLRVKRAANGRKYITAEAAAEWRANLPDA